MVPLAEQIEKYCCEVVDDLIQGKPDEDGFKTRRKEPQGRQFSAKGNVTSRLTVPPFKKKPFAGSKPFARNRPFNSGNMPNAENQQFRPPPFPGQRQGFKRHFIGKTTEECKALRDAKKCYICEEEEGHFANECPQRNSQNKDDKSDRKGKKPKSQVQDLYHIWWVTSRMFMPRNCAGHGGKLEINKCWSSLIEELVPISFHQSWHPSWECVQRIGNDKRGKERLFPKLGMRYYGLFEVCSKISDVAYRLKLPKGWKIHNAFHVSLLRPFVGDVPEDMVPEDQPEVEELDEILVPEQILAHKDRKVRGKVARRYLVKFKNYSPMDAKWMEEAELVDSPQLLQLYLEAFQLQPTVT
ncbi:hypothetical protein L7F22_024661 [Adiantum nelumboides]|nr:hypothetical protein [Adiantum nelumboides]